MFARFRTFDSTPLTFDEALEFMPMMNKASKELVEQKQRGTPIPQYMPLRELWGGLTGALTISTATTVMPKCVDWTMPIEYTIAIRRSAGVTTAYAYCELAKALLKVRDLNDDLEVRAAMVEGWKEFEKRRQEANDVQEGLGCDESQSWHTMRDIDDKSGNADLKRQMIAIAKLAGRLYTSFGYQRKDQPNEDPEEVSATRQGGNIERLLPTELALLGDDETADMQAMKILENQATELQMKGVESKNRGPLVILIDESGSMNDGVPGHHGYHQGHRFNGRNTWAKACAVALTRIAWQEDRAVVAVHFGSAAVCQQVPKDDYRAMFEMARSFLSGGTVFETAMKMGLKQVDNLAARGLAGADILIITDGCEPDYAAHNRMIDEMDAQSVRLWTVAIGERIDASAPVRKRAEKYTFAADNQLSDPSTSVQLADGLNEAAMGNGPDRNLN